MVDAHCFYWRCFLTGRHVFRKKRFDCIVSLWMHGTYQSNTRHLRFASITTTKIIRIFVFSPGSPFTRP